MIETHLHGHEGDLLKQDAIRDAVRQVYGDVRPTDGEVARRFYSASELEGLPEDAVSMALGVGAPARHAALRLGERVVDLGSGGIDCLVAGRAVGASGEVVGVDFLPDMVARAARSAAAARLGQVRFVEGQIESPPLPDGWADVVISNGVVNLSPRKVRVLSEAFRMLRPGGRLAIVDLVVDRDLPPEVRTHPAAWAGCLSGALSEIALYKGVRRAGFREVEIKSLEPFGIKECELYPLFSEELLALLRDRVPAERHDSIAMSVLVRARKPAPGEKLPARARRS